MKNSSTKINYKDQHNKLLLTTDIINRVRICLIARYGEDYMSHYSPAYYKIVTTFWKYLHQRDTDNFGFVPISTFKFREVVGARLSGKSLADIIRRELIEMDIIECDNICINNIPGKDNKCFGYRFSDKYLPKLETLQEIACEPPANIKKELLTDPEHANHIKTLKQVHIDYKAACAYISEKLKKGELTTKGEEFNSYKAAHWTASAFYIYHKQFAYNVSPGLDRVHTSITNLPSELRQFLYFKKEQKLCVVDVRNSQPLMINALLRESGLLDVTFKADCVDGIFYDTMQVMMEESHDIKMTRDEVKMKCFKNILFGFDGRSKITKVFADRYPVAYKFIEEQKADVDDEAGNRRFAIKLQNMEAKICLGALKELHEGGLLALGIHDAVLIAPEHVEIAKQTLLTHFDKFGLVPEFSIKQY